MFDNNCCQFVHWKGPVNNVSNSCPNIISDPQTARCVPDSNHSLSKQTSNQFVDLISKI